MDELNEKNIERILTDPHNGLVAPSSLRAPLLRLSGGAGEVEAAVCLATNQGDLSTWDIIWLTPRFLVVGSASKTQPSMWTSTSPDQSPDELEVWARALSEVRQISYYPTDTGASRDASEAKVARREVYEVRFTDDTTVLLPPTLTHAAGWVADQPALELLGRLSAAL